MAFARTVLGDVDTEMLGVVLAHEHLIIDSPVVARRWPHIHLPSVDEATAEARQISDVGVGTLVDAMPVGGGGDPGRLAEIARATRLNVVAATGMHTAKYYEGDGAILDAAVEQLSARFEHDVVEGTDGIRAGVLKVATAGASPTAQEERLFEAASITHHSTGVPIITHCEEGLDGVKQVDMLGSFGVSLDRVALSHVDKVGDVLYHRDLAEMGVLLCYDQGLRAPEQTMRLVTDMFEMGHGSRLLIGTDGARRTLWATLGGDPGLAWIHSGFRRGLSDRGLGEGDLVQMFVANPARWLSFSV
jgi:phosphotriesterase-related protein